MDYGSSLTFGSLFAGIGGFDLGLERAGMECRWQVEIDPFCQKVLAKHWPDVRRYEDVREVGKHNLEAVDLICGGFPCQDISKANAHGEGLDGGRSGLWSEFLRILGGLRPQYAVVENTANITNRGLDRVIGELSSIGFDAEWELISACAFGAPHPRSRMFIVAYPNKQRQEGRWAKRDNGDDEVGGWRQNCEDHIRPIALTGRSPRRPHWNDESSVDRMVDGSSTTLDRSRLRALGNAVVPQVAEWIGRRIVAVENQHR